MEERGRRREERKPGYRNYCGSETCATAAYLNEDRENADGRSAREKSGAEIERMKRKAGTGEKNRETKLPHKRRKETANNNIRPG